MSDLSDPKEACDVLREAAELVREDPEREGSLLRFGAAGQLVATGDFHGNLRNFEKLQRYCDLAHRPARKIVLHELIHADPAPPEYLDLSIDLLVRAAAWKCEFPDNVFFLQSNHELSQLQRHEITKGGRSVLNDFARGVEFRYNEGVVDVLDAVDTYISSLPLAARTAKGVFLSHSLPDPAVIDEFDVSVFSRRPTGLDFHPSGPAYRLLWGRFQQPEDLDRLAEKLGVSVFIVGHTPQESGLKVVGRMIVLASDHAHGVFLPIDLARSYDAEALAQLARKFVSVE